jgi:hypothetical protein
MTEKFDPVATVNQLLKTSKDILNEKDSDYATGERRLIAEINALQPGEINQIRQTLAANDDKHLFNFLPSLHLDFGDNHKLLRADIRRGSLTGDRTGEEVIHIDESDTFDAVRDLDVVMFRQQPGVEIEAKRIEYTAQRSLAGNVGAADALAGELNALQSPLDKDYLDAVNAQLAKDNKASPLLPQISIEPVPSIWPWPHGQELRISKGAYDQQVFYSGGVVEISRGNALGPSVEDTIYQGDWWKVHNLTSVREPGL